MYSDASVGREDAIVVDILILLHETTASVSSALNHSGAFAGLWTIIGNAKFSR